jgi:hypothetical protein
LFVRFGSRETGNSRLRAGSIDSAGGTGKPGCPDGACEAGGQGRRLRAGKDETLAGAPARCLKMGNGSFPKSETVARTSRVADLGYVVVASRVNSLLARYFAAFGTELGTEARLQVRSSCSKGAEVRLSKGVAPVRAIRNAVQHCSRWWQSQRNAERSKRDTRLLPKEGVSVKRKGLPIIPLMVSRDRHRT